jgi:hypothetical protein
MWLQLDEVADGMAGAPWIRYHEYFAALSELHQPSSSSKANGTEMCHNTIMTAMREAAIPNMAFAGHGGNYSDRCSLDLTFAIFMIARNGLIGQPIDFIQWSTGRYWNTKNWNWTETASLYTHDWGLPKGLGTRSGSVWQREYERAVITVDCATLKPSIELLP